MKNVRELVLQQDVSIFCHLLSTPGKIKYSLAPCTVGGHCTHTHTGIDCSWPLWKPNGALGHQRNGTEGELLVEQSYTQPYLLYLFVHRSAQLQNPPAAIVFNWLFVIMWNQPWDTSCDSYVKYSLYYSITTSPTHKINAK